MTGYEKRFKYLAEKLIKRDGIKEVMAFLDMSDFYTAPASTKYHDAHEGGLVKHTLAVFDMLTEELGFNGGYPEPAELESCAIVALFHDLCKVNFYTVSERNVKIDNKWEKVPYYTVDDKLPFGHGEKSVFMLMSLGLMPTIEEAMAIRWHMGLSVPKEDQMAMSKAFEEFPLAVQLHIADLKATYLTGGRDERISPKTC